MEAADSNFHLSFPIEASSTILTEEEPKSIPILGRLDMILLSTNFYYLTRSDPEKTALVKIE